LLIVKNARSLLDEVDQQPEHVIADKGYDSDEIIKEVEERGACSSHSPQIEQKEATGIR